MKRLLCIVGGMNVGGAETFLMKIYRKLDKNLYQMDFAVGVKEKCFYDDEILSLGGKIYHICPKSKGLIKNLKSVKALIKENKYEYVLRTSQNSLSALELYAAKRGGAKVVAFRSSNSGTVSGSRKEKTFHKLFSFMPRRFANVKIAPSTEAAVFMFGKKCFENGKVNILKNGIDFDVYKFDKNARSAVRKEFDIAADVPVFGHIGRFNQQKNHKFLIEIFAEIKKLNEKAVLFLVGTGELEDEIKRLVSEKGLTKSVIFAGVRSDVPALLSAMDVFVFPSLYEGMPNTVIEAQAAGLNCIISDTITKEADITGIVKYESLGAAAEIWADRALALVTDKRADTKESFTKNGYDINSVTAEFVKLIFGDKQ